MSEIVNDKNIIAELNGKIRTIEHERRELEEKRREFRHEQEELEQKKSEYGEDISEETKEQMMEVINKVIEKIAEITSQIDEKSTKIDELRDTLNVPEALPIPPIEQIVPPMEIIMMSAYDRKMREFDDKIAECERKIEVKEREIDNYTVQKDREIDILENKKARLDDTYRTIEDKLNGNINDATRERLEEMRDEVEEKINDLSDKINDVEDQKNDNRSDREDEIEELRERIEEINEERAEYEHDYVDENVISEIESLPGFDENAEIFGHMELDEVDKVKEINIEMLEDIERKYADGSNEERERQRRLRHEKKLHVNFCAGAKIDSFCCHNDDKGRPENLIDTDSGLKTKWDATHKHFIEVGPPHWVIVDLGESKIFNYVQIIKSSEGRGSRDAKNTRNDMSAWRIEVSDDKQNWREFNREANDKTSVYEKYFETKQGRYIRLLIDAAEQDPKNKNGHVRIYGFKIKMRDDLNNVDFTKTARIDSYCHQHSRDERAEYILNDNINQKWCATDNHTERIKMPHWVIIDFGENKTFNHLRMVKASEAGEKVWDRGRKNLDMSAWRFEVSEDKQTWSEFNSETNDQSSIYIKTFEPQTGRYVRLWVDAGGSNPNNKEEPARIYDLRIDMINNAIEDKTVTFDDIIAIAPFAKKETLDKLADKLTDIDNFAKVKEICKFLSESSINKLIWKAFEKDDFNMIIALAPFASKEAIEKIVFALDGEVEFDKIKALAPFLSKEVIAGIVIGGGNADIRKLRELAPLLGSALIDEIVQRMF